MKKVIAIVLVIGLLLTTSLASGNAFETRESQEQPEELPGQSQPIKLIPYANIYVDDDFNETTPGWNDTHFDNIQDGIDHACEGDKIYVFNGLYDELIDISKSVKLIGEDRYSTIINGAIEAYGIDGITIRGFTVVKGTSVQHVILSLGGCSNCIIRDNTITNNDRDGIYIGYCDNNIITDNTITNNGALGFNIWYSDNNIITDNTITNNSCHGIWLADDSFNNIITDNTITNNGWDGIFIHYARNNSITDNNITNNGWDGIRIDDNPNIWKSYNIIRDNTITNNGKEGILIDNSDNNIITDNNITNNGCDGILIDKSDNNIITDNNITNNVKDGIRLCYAYYNTFSGNTIANNKRFGISFSHPEDEEPVAFPSKFNTFSGNTIRDNARFGVYVNKLYYGYGNLFYYNNFIDNDKNARDEGIINLWYNPIIMKGNYWDDYVEKGGYDSDGDGIGDIPYKIPGKIIQSKDWYPVMEPFDIGNIDVSNVITEEMTSEESQYLTELEEMINNQILSGEFNIDDIMNSYMCIVSAVSSQSHSTPLILGGQSNNN